MRSITIEKIHCLEPQSIVLSENRTRLPRPAKKRKKNLVSVIFLTWERDTHIGKTIFAFKEFVKRVEPNVKFEMVSFDNGSSNSKINSILSQHKWDVRIKNPTNLGISAGLKKAIDNTSGEFVVCLEDDWETIAKRPLFAPSMRIMNEFDDIGGVRHKESAQNYIISKTDVDEDKMTAEFDKDSMDNAGIPWRGKYGRRRWFDQRVTSFGDKFYTWSNPKPWVPSVFCNPCFIMRGEAFDRIQPMKNEASYSHLFGNYYNAAVLVDEPKFIHRGEKRHARGNWHE